MRKPVLSRRIVALVAAYVVALQALLLPLSVAAQATFSSSLCAQAVSAEGLPPPASHETGCPCAAGCGMACCGQALISPPEIKAAIAPAYARVTTPAPAFERIARAPAKGPQVARGPPAI